MRTIFFLALLVIGLVVAGVLQFQKNGDNISIHIDQQRLHQVEQEAVQEGSQLLNKAQTDLQSANQTTQSGLSR